MFKIPVSCLALLFLCAQWGEPLPRASAQQYRGAAEPLTPLPRYGQGVRDTQWRSPDQERLGFHVPPGFAVELVAAEPEIAKPLNMAWDWRGRLWVSSTVEYPYPAAEGVTPRDQILILEDTDADGQMDKTTLFADKLNIPMGLLPVQGGVICFAIPNVWFLHDQNGDDHVDRRELLLGPFDTSRDTHGMINALRRGEDGWIYACHGFNNRSHVAAADGSSLTLNSGNTFRFRPDGSRVEHFTQGQVNPFGMTSDQWGHLYTADCHSKPITALLRGGCYPSFGRPHDGLGFAPSMMSHLHGSTAISGLQYYQAEHFPAAYRRLLYSGNVMTSRINANRLVYRGATAQAEELPDFLTSDDPWFRPVDLRLGPDGALYIADFYNKIIGHYEVPLDHPGRDRESGRIWRVVYRGDEDAAQLEPLHLASEPAELANTNVARRRAAVQRTLATLSRAESRPPARTDGAERDEVGVARQTTLQRLSKRLVSGQASALEQISLIEVLRRSGALDEQAIEKGLSSQDPLVLIRYVAACGDLADLSAAMLARLRALLESEHPQIQRAALEVMARHGSAADVVTMLQLVQAYSGDDPALSQLAKIAARSLLADSRLLNEVAGQLLAENAPQADHELVPAFTEILPALRSRSAAAALLRYVTESMTDTERSGPAELREQAFSVGLNYASGKVLEQLVELLPTLESTAAGQAERLVGLWRALERGTSPSEPLRDLRSKLEDALRMALETTLAEQAKPVTWASENGEHWKTEQRECGDGMAAMLFSSFTLGESYVGHWRSEAFDAPQEISFWLAGHNGPPKQGDQRRNFVRLIHATSGIELARAWPPRNDRAVRVVWQFAEDEVGQPVRIEIQDGDPGQAYAWLAVGRFSPPWIDALEAEKQIAALEQLLSLPDDSDGRRSPPGWLIGSPDGERLALSGRPRVRLLAAAYQGQRQLVLSDLARHANRVGQPDLIDRLFTADSLPARAPDEGDWWKVAKQLGAVSTYSQQRSLAAELLRHPAGCYLLERLLDSGSLPEAALAGQPSALPSALKRSTASLLRKAISASVDQSPQVQAASLRVERLAQVEVDQAVGAQMFVQHCAACHQLGGQGKVIGPQLDGVLSRGRQRLTEDILVPNLNVDVAFRQSSLLLDDDTVITGLVGEASDGRLVITLQDGKQTEIEVGSVVQRRESTVSLMPGNFGEVMTDRELASLLYYLQTFKP